MQYATARNLNTRPVNSFDREYAIIKGRRKSRAVTRVKTALFLMVTFGVLAVVITYYLSLQAGITNSVKVISAKESRLNEIRLDNDENYSRITSNVDLEEIRRVAIQELGMRYAEEGQIISFDGEGSDYVRQTGVIPD
ncbi:MAG: hypothetical protein MJZ11_03090 [Lachnospiraceae bacterium]|nr:hypothetical protein [Lachnospiraceae bacterium]